MKPGKPAAPPQSGLGTLGALLSARGLQKSEAPPAPLPVVATTPATAPDVWQLTAHVALQIERAGRGGRTVTWLKGLAGTEEQLEGAVSDLKKALGTGASVEDGGVFVQGDQRARLRSWLLGKGVRRVTG